MKSVYLDLPTLGFIVATRAALGVGIGLLVSEGLPVQRRRVIGVTLVAIGAATSVPAIASVIRGVREAKRKDINRPISHDDELVGTTRFPRKGDDDF